MNHNHHWFTTAIILLLTACSTQESQNTTVSIVPTVQIKQETSYVTATHPQTATKQRQVTPTPKKNTLTPTITKQEPIFTLSNIATSVPVVVQEICPDIKSTLPDSLGGTVVLSGDAITVLGKSFQPDSGKESILLFWNLLTGGKATYSLPESERGYYYASSPNHLWLAVAYGKSGPVDFGLIDFDLMIMSAQGIRYGTILLPGEWNLFDWLNNEEILIRPIIRKNGTDGDEFPLIAINPYSGKQEILSVNYPGLEKKNYMAYGAKTIYNNDRSAVVYYRHDGDWYAVVWDILKNKEIARVADSHYPKWSPDGRKVTFRERSGGFPNGVNDEIISVNKDGNIERLTNFQDIYFADYITDLVWSPDGRYIAFLMVVGDNFLARMANLAILDTTTHMIVIYCYETYYRPLRFSDDMLLGFAYEQINSVSLIWSPNSTHIMMEQAGSGRYSDHKTYLIDVLDHAVYRMSEDARPVGWLASP